MLAVSDFDEIRPYRDEEVPEIMSRLLVDPVFTRVLHNLFVEETKIQEIRDAMTRTKDVESFQLTFMVPFLERIISSSISQLTIGGLENLEKDKSYLFISNHRDIVLDSALLNVEIYKHGFKPTEIAIGSNLLVYQWIEDVSRVNRSFIVKRNIPVREMLRSSHLLSEYIRQTVITNGNSIWIAQREGRSKDGLDQTSPALLKMLNMSNKRKFVRGFQELSIVPMSISYEIEPCGNEKVAELLKRQADPDFRKTEKDDLLSMVSGLKNQKGRVHIQFGNPINRSAPSVSTRLTSRPTSAKCTVSPASSGWMSRSSSPTRPGSSSLRVTPSTNRSSRRSRFPSPPTNRAPASSLRATMNGNPPCWCCVPTSR